MWVWVGSALVAALAGSPHCLGMCGALACSAGDRADRHLAYHVGRIGTYASLGAVSGAVGHGVPGPAWLSSAFAAIFLVGFSASLAGWIREPALAVPGIARIGMRVGRRTDLPSRVVFGAVNGLLPCGLVYAALALAVASGGAVAGAAVMAVFGLGTVPALLAATFGLRSVVSRSRSVRRLLAGVVLASGLVSLGYRAGLFSSADPGSDAPPCHRAAVGS